MFRNFGAAYVFKRDSSASGGWIQEAQGKLTAYDTFRPGNIQFGYSVAIQAGRIVVGAPGDDSQGTGSGSAYVFERNGSDWIRHPLTQKDPGPGEQFGNAVQIDGSRVLVGARFDGGGGREAGAAYLFEKQSDNTWKQTKIILSRPAPGAAFGQSVAILGEEIFLGGFQDDVDSTEDEEDAGAVTVCKKKDIPPPQADLAVIRKTDGRGAVCAGDSVTYQITVRNNGPDPVTGARVTDDLPGNLQRVSWTCSGRNGATCPASGSNDIDELINLPVNSAVEYRVDATVSGGGTVMNEACVEPPTGVTDPNPDPSSNCKRDTDTVSTVDLALTATDPIAVCGGTLSYTLTITNEGGQAADDVEVVVFTPIGLTPSPLSGCSISAGNIVCTLDRVRAGESFDFPITFSIPVCYEKSDIIRAEVSTADLDCGSSNDQVSKPFSVNCRADLEIGKTGDESVNPDGMIDYILTVTNHGPHHACEVVLTDPIPTGLVSPVVPAGCEVVLGNVVQCRFDKLPPAQSRTFPVSFTVPQDAECGSEIPNIATVTAKTLDPNGGNNDSVPTTTTVACCDEPSITKTDGRETAMPGKLCSTRSSSRTRATLTSPRPL